MARHRLSLAGAAVLGATTQIHSQIHSTGLLVDLGDGVGSRLWWRGAATLVVLAATVVVLGARIPPVAGPLAASVAHVAADETRATAIASLAEGSTTGLHVAPGALVHRLAETPERPRIGLTARLGAGGLDASLRRAGVSAADRQQVQTLWARYGRGVTLKNGTDLHLILGRRASRVDPRPLETLSFRPAFEWNAEIARDSSGALVLKRVPIRIDDTPLRVTGQVGTSLDRSLRAAGLPGNVVAEYRRQLSHVLDLQREVGRDAQFEVIVAHRRAETGETEMGQLLYAGLSGKRSDVSLMRWGRYNEFFRGNGESVHEGLMRSPLSGPTRRSSGFGMRFHPVLGYSRMHKGTDFAAPTGTGILASASGRVVRAGRWGGYGNVVEVDHGNGLRTRYAHMSRVGVKVGQKVSQGQVIGAVGATGLATGPHLHYEIWQNGVAKNPTEAKYSGGSRLGGTELRRFKGEMQRLQKLAEVGTAAG